VIEALMSYIRPTVGDQDGQAFAEYALLIAVLSVALLLAFQQLGGSLQGLVTYIENFL
jgi:Flp pilus assembly pilin Flp